jgi:hypothetical protein
MFPASRGEYVCVLLQDAGCEGHGYLTIAGVIMNILIATAELTPLAKAGGLADIAAALPD